MRVEKVYIADDGTRFEGATAYADCTKYEQDKEWESCGKLRNYIRFYSWDGTELNAKFVSQNIFSVYFVKVLDVPDEEGHEEIYHLWNKTVSCDLDDAICHYELGWYCSNGDDDWCYWGNLVKDYEECKATIEKIEQGQ
jgi:hypothetical protein